MTSNSGLNSIFDNDLVIDVSFYDREHEKLLTEGRYPQSAVDKMKELTANGLSVSGSDFLLYYLLHYKKLNPLKYKSLPDITPLVISLKPLLEDILCISGGSLHVDNEHISISTEMAEHIGEAIGMLVIAEVYDLIDVDWGVIPVKQTKDFDFITAYSSSGSVLLETKGSQVLDNKYKEPTISNHKKDIKVKKEAIRPSVTGDFFHGTITAIDHNDSAKIKCWLLDPPSIKDNNDIFKSRLLTKLKNLHGVFKIISPNSGLIGALELRIDELKFSSVPHSFNKKHLTTKKGAAYYYKDAYQSPFFHHKILIDTKTFNGGGICVEISKNTFFFFGIEDSIVKMIEEQSLEKIVNYQHSEKSEEVDLIWQLDPAVKWSREIASKYPRSNFHLRGSIHSSKSGIMIGCLTVT